MPQDILRTDIIIIGAGAAGLAAANVLRRHGRRVAVLEARNRVGGRILTHRISAFPVPIELGAEFLHGKTPKSDAIISAAGLTAYEVPSNRWQVQQGGLRPVEDFEERLERVFKHLGSRKRQADQSFTEALRHRGPGPLSRLDQQLARQFVQGFHAADIERISMQALAAGNDSEDDDSMRIGRILDGYDRVPHWLAQQIDTDIHYNTVAERVVWERGKVRVETRTSRSRPAQIFTGHAVIVTVPVGVLQASPPQAGAILFDPPIPSVQRAVSQLAMGHVTRMTFTFREAFWLRKRPRTKGDAKLEHASFFQGIDTKIPVWWTMYPLRLPVLIGWAGGPPGFTLAQERAAIQQEQALQALAAHFGFTRRRLESWVTGCYTHNWTRDPYARGAYSYALAGGSEAGRRLGRPVQDTVYFAGEATAEQVYTGTVEGALMAGEKAAHHILGK